MAACGWVPVQLASLAPTGAWLVEVMRREAGMPGHRHQAVTSVDLGIDQDERMAVMASVKRYLRAVAQGSRRRLALAPQGSDRLTAHEASLLAAIGAGQRGQDIEAAAHLEWLCATVVPANVHSAQEGILVTLDLCGLNVGQLEDRNPLSSPASPIVLRAVG